MVAIISRGLRKSERRLMLLGVDLRDAREEIFCRMVCDGIALGVAFSRAGFTSKDHNAPSKLFALPRVQERANAILDARRSTGVVTLPQVTDMLQRVFAGAHAAEEYSAAHNAAFSLARLYGHVTDRATLEVIRRPSRDPDAPSEQALSSWVEALPALAGPGPNAGLEALGPVGEASFLRLVDAPAPPLGQPEAQPELHNNINWLEGEARGPEGPGLEKLNEINVLEGPGPTPGQSENGAPSGPVTGTPNASGSTELLADGGPGPTPSKKEGLIGDEGTGTDWGKVYDGPSFEDLFG
jgi:hypothetical protein